MIKIVERIDNVGDMLYNDEEENDEENYKSEEYLEIENDVLVKCDEEVTGHIDIPNSVTKIGDEAFEHCESLESITIPNSVIEIGKYAFEGCYSLKSITIPKNVTDIGWRAFVYCPTLTIKCYKDSFADAYAKMNDIEVEHI